MFQSLQIDEEEYTDEYTLFVKDIDLNHNQKMFNTKMDNDPIEKMGFAEFYILNTTINPTTTDKTTISTEVTTSDDSNLGPFIKDVINQGGGGCQKMILLNKLI